ncbi:MAG TPA: DUF2878 domain-containing protein [Pseudoxanthomonas sp.]
MGAVLNALGYQGVWFIAVAAAARDQPWWGVIAASVFIAVQWAFSATRRDDLKLLVVAVALGALLDGTFALNGWLHYAAGQPGMVAPTWILAIWAAFALTLNHSLRFLQGRPWWSMLLGAIGGPLAYLGAARGFGAVTFIAPGYAGLAALAVAWAVALPLLMHLAWRWRAETLATSVQVSP